MTEFVESARLKLDPRPRRRRPVDAPVLAAL